MAREDRDAETAAHQPRADQVREDEDAVVPEADHDRVGSGGQPIEVFGTRDDADAPGRRQGLDDQPDQHGRDPQLEVLEARHRGGGGYVDCSR